MVAVVNGVECFIEELDNTVCLSCIYMPNDETPLDKLKEIIEKAEEKWYEDDTCETLHEYIGSALDDAGIAYDAYVKENIE